MSMTKREYLKDIETIARDLFDEAVEEGNRDWDSVSDYVYEMVDERVQGHRFAIYSGLGLQILPLSENPDAYFEQGLGKLEADSCSGVFEQLAFWAVRQDALDAFNDLVEGWLAELPSEEEVA